MIEMTEDHEAILFVAMLVAAVSFYFFVCMWKYWRLIQDTPTSRLRSAHQGFVELEGKGRFSQDYPVYAPLSNHRCIWYQSLVECKSGFGSRSSWRVVYQNTSDSPFLFDDGTGTCVIDPRDAEVVSDEALIWYGNTEWPTRTGVMDSAPFAMALKNRYRYTERLILPGQRLYVLGQLSTHSPSTHRSLRDVERDLLSGWKLDSEQLRLRFDSNHDGKINLTEWEMARKVAKSEAEAVHQAMQFEPATNHVFRPGDRQRPFVISVQPQAVIVANSRHKVIATLVCFVGAVGYLIWQLQTY